MAEDTAFCLLLWTAQGGTVSHGKPIFGSGQQISGNCDNPDCWNCPIMRYELAQHVAGMANWVCPSCLRSVVTKGKEQSFPVQITGHYAEGICQFDGCTRPPRVELVDEVDEPIEVPARYSRFLQLVIGDINR